MILKYSEINLDTFQGEGEFAGVPCNFLRLSGCNLSCIWCDTPYTWNWVNTKFKHPEKFDPKKEVFSIEVNKLATLLNKHELKHLVISGGEPLLQQKKLTLLLQQLQGYFVEVETNGTIEPEDDFAKLVNRFNVSPKLKMSENSKPAIKIDALLKLISYNTILKFVVQTENDIEELNKILTQLNIEKNRVYLMPLATSLEQLNKGLLFLKDKGFRISSRFHIEKYGKDLRGV